VNLPGRAIQSLNDLLHGADQAQSLVVRGHKAYWDDEALRLAGEAVLIHMGEAAARALRAAPELAQTQPNLELPNLIATRNVIAHGYDMVDHGVVWTVLTVDLPNVAKATREVLDATNQTP
jgi:uncharacterized protein with HEPN domain